MGERERQRDRKRTIERYQCEKEERDSDGREKR